jgi:rod shape-determining protein MreB and related proteins
MGRFFNKKLGIDLGTANSVVFVEGQGIILMEPTVVALDLNKSSILAVGDEAKDMIGKTPENIVAKRPLRNGVIADSRITESLLKYFFNKALGSGRFLKPDVIISVPAGINSVERRAVMKAAVGAGARKIYLMPEPLLAAIGAGIPIYKSSGSMIVNMGGGTTEIGILSLNGLVQASSVRVSGDAMNDAIVNYMRRHHNLVIGDQTGESVKTQIGSCLKVNEPKSIEIKGRDSATGMPRSIRIDSNEIAAALQGPLNQIIDEIQNVLEKTPPELSADIMEKGIVLSGGTALLGNIDKLFAKATGVPVYVADEPIYCVANGTGAVLEMIADGDFSFATW